MARKGRYGIYKPIILKNNLNTSNPTVVLPGKGELVVTGYAPSIATKINSNKGDLIITGYAPAIKVIVIANKGELQITGYAPTISTSIVTGKGELILTGYEPSIGEVIAPETGHLTVTGYRPIISTGSIQSGGGGGKTLNEILELMNRPRILQEDEFLLDIINSYIHETV